MSIVCCSTLLTGTKRIEGRLTASQIAAASLPSFLPLLRYGTTNLGAISFTVWPCCAKRRAHSCAPEHASIPMTLAGSCATNDASRALLTVLRNTTTPRASTPCSENTFFAKSIPTVVTLLTRLPLRG